MGNNNQLRTMANAEQFIYRLTYTEKINNAELPHTEQQLSDTFCLLFSISGSGLLTLNDQKWRLKNLTLYTIMPGETFMLKNRALSKTRALSVSLSALHTARSKHRRSIN